MPESIFPLVRCALCSALYSTPLNSDVEPLSIPLLVYLFGFGSPDVN